MNLYFIFAIKDDGNIERNVAIIVVDKKVRNKAIKITCLIKIVSKSHLFFFASMDKFSAAKTQLNKS